jgi:transposase
MEHIGIDLGASRSAICAVSSEGAVLLERALGTREIEHFLSKRSKSRVAVESCAESRLVAIRAREQGHDVRVVPSVFVRSLGIGTRRIKTDKRDAKNLAIASFRLGDELPHIHIRSNDAAALQDLVRARSNLVSLRTMAINFVRAQLRKALLGTGPRRSAKTFCSGVREILGENTLLEVNAHLATIDVVNEQIEGLEKKMKAVAEASEPATRLRNITGVGPIVSVAFLAAIADPKRFASGSHLASYIGLSPGENTTGGKVHRTGIVAAGQRQLRGLLVQAAHSMLNARRTREPMAQWALKLERRRGRKVAVCALARRLAIVMWAMLRDGTRYDPTMTRPRERADPTEELAKAIASGTATKPASINT